MKRIWFSAICILAIVPRSLPESDNSSFTGLSGRALADAVRLAYSPSAEPPDEWIPEEWMLPARTDAMLVPDEWWHESPRRDLYNIIRASDDFTTARRDYPPAPLDIVAESGDGWETGIGLQTNAWQPAPERRGDLARRMMYMALMYPQPLWRSRAAVVFDDGPWPLLTPAGADIFLAWHRADPPDSREIDEMMRIAAAQGNTNPFTEIPELAEYLWGDRAGLGYVPPETEKERVPLRGTYRRSSDSEIDLYSPHVDGDATWTLDGNPVTVTAIPLASIADGKHELRFSTSSKKGKLIIEIVP